MRWPSALTDLLADPESERARSPRGRRGRGRAVLLGRGGRRRRWRSTRSSARDDRSRSSSGLAWACSSTPTSAIRRCCGRSLGRAADGPAAGRRRAAPSVSLIVAAHDEEDVIERKVRDALALDYPRDRLRGDRGLGRLDRPHRGARPRRARGRRRCWTSRAGARSRARTRPWSRPAGRSSPSRTPTAIWEPEALRAPGRAARRSGVGYVCGQVRLRRAAGGQPGGPLLALRDGGARTRVAPRRGDGRERRDLRGAPGRVHRPRADPRPGHLVPVQAGQARLARGVRAGGAWRAEPMVADAWRASSARKRRMMSRRLGHDASRTGCCRPARLRPAVRVRDRLAPRCCATRRRCCTWSRSPPTSRCSARAGSTW